MSVGGEFSGVIDLDQVRADTPGCAHVAHLNNSGAALMPAPVLDAVVDYLRLEAVMGGYEAAAASADVIDAVYDLTAQLIGAHRHEIAIVENATRAWDMAFYGLSFAKGDRILTTTTEYASNYIAYLQVAERRGVHVEVVPDAPSGEIDVAALESMIDDRVRLISLNHVPTHGGLVNPAAEVGAVARRHGVPFLLDACQSIGQLPIDVAAIGCDMMSATSRKFLRGPRGVGFLYVRRGFLDELDPPFLDLHAATWVAPDRYEIKPDATRFENWESNLAGRVGFGVAVDYALDIGLDAIWDRVRLLGDRLRSDLTEIPGVVVHDRGSVQGAIVSFTVDGVTPEDVKRRAASADINVSVSAPPSTRLDLDHEVVRCAPHYYNSDDELDRLLAVVADLAAT